MNPLVSTLLVFLNDKAGVLSKGLLDKVARKLSMVARSSESLSKLTECPVLELSTMFAVSDTISSEF